MKVKVFYLFAFLLLSNTTYLIGQRSKIDSLKKIVKSKQAKLFCKEGVNLSLEPPMFLLEEQLNLFFFRPRKFILIPTLHFIRQDSIKKLIPAISKNINLDTLFYPIHILAFNRVGQYSGILEGAGFTLDITEEWSSVNYFNMNRNQKRIGKTKYKDIARKIRRINPDFIFMMPHVYHTYIYIKRGKIYILDFETLKSYTPEEYEKAFPSR